ncbi:hypothetical protein ACFPM3_18740 [Streptomyces coeruleoprunus]|uniref:SMP-30/Gluconolactonase/LRE-like region domain-containing protein n=1 Tax=Streptomyces coeruleoprunus TaxID=285563 RepID=A0ABV9XFJ7_9ACTN
MFRFPRLAGAAATALALALLAAPATAAGEPTTLTDPRIVAHFDLARGQTPENIALEPDGSANLTMALARQVVRVSKDGQHRRRLATLPRVENPATPVIGVAAVFGIVRTHDGTLYVTYGTGTEETGIWRIHRRGGTPEQVACLPPNGFPNGLALDEHRGHLYAADSVLGTVWRVALKDIHHRDDGDCVRPTAWATGPALSRTNFIGANGIKVHKGAVWVSNLDKGTLLRIPVRRDGTAGTARIRATGLTGIDDFAFAGRGDTAIATLITQNQVVLVRPDGTHTVALTRDDGLSSPTSAAVRGRTVYIPSAAFLTESDPNLLLARLTHKGHKGEKGDKDKDHDKRP